MEFCDINVDGFPDREPGKIYFQKDIFHSPKLSALSRHVYIGIMAYTNDKGECSCKVDDIAKICAISHNTVRNHTKELVAAGFMKKKNEEEIKTYLMFDGKYYKIGKSVSPMDRVRDLKVANPVIRLLAFGKGISEASLHKFYKDKRFKGEWFNLSEKEVHEIISLIMVDSSH